ncbi:AraC family transcriptional regulator [Motilimonas sp. E26]|uniref:AraC family transcriptional regulator n=1 Tax=Motilimonas sp. E26 TaxID=2865674 RepID=UPI001E3731E6|nr:AraC family transcriptional regulator [Motilimonas sp. E26]MCE0556312.1 AraC family transcriptional regulator [Motilimonas sp. E26]
MQKKLDPLSQFVHFLSPSSEIFTHVTLSAPWGIEADQLNSAYVAYLPAGTCVLELEGRESVTLFAGQMLILPYGHAHCIKSDIHAKCVKVNELLNEKKGAGEQWHNASNGDSCELVYGTFSFAPMQHWGKDALIGSLPEMIVLNVPSGSRLVQLLTWLYQENSQPQAGQSLAIEYLMQLLLIEMLRNLDHFTHYPSWMAALQDTRLAPVILAIQQQFCRDWTVDELARLAAMSRSVFAEKFKTTTGTSPLLFLRQWRCFIAAQWLVNERFTVAQIAHKVGFQSVDVFIRNFRQFHDCTPKQYATRVAKTNP